MYKLSSKSINNLKGVHKDLVKIFLAAIKTSPIDFTILEGVRSQKRQNQLFKEGKSQRDGIHKKSEHQIKSDGFGYAVDAVPYPIDWKNISKFKELGKHIKKTAKELNINITWGGDWKTFKDYPHYELNERG